MIPASAVAGTELLGGFFSKFLFSIFAIFMLFNYISEVSTTHSWQESLMNTGKGFFISTQEIISQSNDIINNNGIYLQNTSIWSIIAIYISLIYSILSMFVGIKLIVFIISLTPWGNNTNLFYNWSAGLLLIYVLEVIFLLGYHGYLHDINGIIGEGSVSYYISLPITSLIQLFKALSIAFTPLVDRVNAIQLNNISSH